MRPERSIHMKVFENRMYFLVVEYFSRHLPLLEIFLLIQKPYLS